MEAVIIILAQILFTFFVFVGFFWLIVKYVQAHIKRVQTINNYAFARGWTTIGSDDQNLAYYVPKRLQYKGDRHTYDLAYQVMVNQRQGYFFEYTIWTDTTDQDGQAQSTGTSFVVLAFELAGISDIEVLSRNWLHNISFLTSRDPELTLEGDFSKHFRVIIQPNQQIEALTLLTPDTMHMMKEQGRKYSMQTQSGWVILYDDYARFDVKRMQKMVAYAEILQPELAQKLRLRR